MDVSRRDFLSKQQKAALEYIYSFNLREGITPTLRELQTALGYSAIGSAQDLVLKLRTKGCIEPRGTQQRARSLRVTPKGMRELKDIVAMDTGPQYGEAFQVPCLGSVPAGNPLEAVEERIGSIGLGLDNFQSKRPAVEKLFSVRAVGESMVNAGILDGDWLIVESCNEAEPKAIVVARFDDEATVKRLMIDDFGWYLQPENPEFSIVRASERPFEVIGKVVAVKRFLQ